MSKEADNFKQWLNNWAIEENTETAELVGLAEDMYLKLAKLEEAQENPLFVDHAIGSQWRCKFCKVVHTSENT